MYNYKQFNESRLSTSGNFYLKRIKESKSGKAVLYGFELKNRKFSLWIPVKAVYNEIENVIDKLPSEYKLLVLGAFIFNPDEWDDSYDQKTEFFDNYNKYMQPIIDKLENDKTTFLNNNLIKRFKNVITKMLSINVGSYNKETDSIETDLGDFYIYKKNPLTFRIGKVFITEEEEGLNINYNNDFYIKATGKNGLIAKALIKINSNQQLSAVEKMAIKRIYTDSLKSHDWEYDMADDKRSRAYGKNNANKINVLDKILKDLGLGEYAKTQYNYYNPKNI